MAKSIASLISDLGALGLRLLGGFPIDAGTPSLDRDHGSLLLIGNTGAEFWPRFRADCAWDAELSEGPDQLDRWTKARLEPMAARHRMSAYFPFGGPPYYPFSRWAAASGRYTSSPIGLVVHEEYGLWSAFRAAFVTPDQLDFGELYTPAAGAPCEQCTAKPCLTTCPVSAFQPGGYAVDTCRNHLRQREAICPTKGCLARLACPLGKAYHYPPEQAAHHMGAFRSG